MDERAVEREVFDWGVRLVARPFKSGKNQGAVIRSEISVTKPTRGCEVRISFPGVTLTAPFRLTDAQAWHEAMGAIINATRGVVAEMKASPKRKS
jgi:hypothetical protein